MSISDREAAEIGEKLYEQYGEPLEDAHSGEYIAITVDGQVLLGNDLIDVVDRAAEVFGSGVYLFKVGERAIGNWR